MKKVSKATNDLFFFKRYVFSFFKSDSVLLMFRLAVYTGILWNAYCNVEFQPCFQILLCSRSDVNGELHI